MSEAKSGVGASFPGCRFAHPGYEISKKKNPADASAGFRNQGAINSAPIRSIADLDAAEAPAVTIPEALADQAAGGLFDIDRGGCNIYRGRAACRDRPAKQRATDQAAGNARGDLAIPGPGGWYNRH
jgi:hypothetical protein